LKLYYLQCDIRRASNDVTQADILPLGDASTRAFVEPSLHLTQPTETDLLLVRVLCAAGCASATTRVALFCFIFPLLCYANTD